MVIKHAGPSDQTGLYPTLVQQTDRDAELAARKPGSTRLVHGSAQTPRLRCGRLRPVGKQHRYSTRSSPPTCRASASRGSADSIWSSASSFRAVLCAGRGAAEYLPVPRARRHARAFDPYHSYDKNLAIAVTGKFEGHLGTFWPRGSVHFFTVRSIDELLPEGHFEHIVVGWAGWLPPLAKTIVLSCTKWL